MGLPSRDIEYENFFSTSEYISWFGSTKETEGKDVPKVNVSIIMTPVGQNRPFGTNEFCKTIKRTDPFTFLSVFQTSLESSNPHEKSISIFKELSKIPAQILFREHLYAWNLLRTNIGIEVSDNIELSNNIQTSLYYILSSIREDWDYSLSPGSLSTNTYNGHIFWDTETWMYPVLLTFYPQLAESVLRYRLERIKYAEHKSAELGYKGAMFPWESAFSGIEVTPTFAETRDLEIHISGDIVHAIDHYMKTNIIENRNTLLRFHELISKVADFYISRSTPRTRDPKGYYDIDLIVPPDEYAILVNNSIFTNAVAQVSFEIATNLSKQLGIQPNPLWTEYAKKIYLPFDQNKNIHLEFEGYSGQKIKQADVILLGYPLMWDPVIQNRQIRLNDLNYYEPVTDENGPAMSWSMYAIGHLEFKDTERAFNLFRKSYNNTHPPFYVWSEIPKGGGTNFITGAGGFLQCVINGYGGLRIFNREHHWEPQLIKNTSIIKFKKIHLRGNRYNVEYDNTFVNIKCEFGRIIIILKNGQNYILNSGISIKIDKTFFKVLV